MMSLSSIYLNKVTEETFEEVVFNVSVDKVVLVYFWSTWCQRCKMMGPILDTIKESYKGSVILASVDVTLHYPLAMQLGIQGLPALVFFKAREIVGELNGNFDETAIRRKLSYLIKP